MTSPPQMIEPDGGPEESQPEEGGSSGGGAGERGAIRLASGAASHVGLVRKQNEDSYVAGGGIFAVCDGMGGARAGEVASEAACRVLLGMLREGPVADNLEQAVHEANALILDQAREDPLLRGMGTTMTAAVATPSGLAIVHVGDSRAYHLRAGVLTQVTDDHSLVGEMVRRGQLTRAQAAVHPHRSVITRALGTDDHVEPDLIEVPLAPGDRVLICSDGLSGMVPDTALARLLGTGDNAQAIADSLVGAALANGGEDNVTAVVVLALADEGSGDDPTRVDDALSFEAADGRDADDDRGSEATWDPTASGAASGDLEAPTFGPPWRMPAARGSATPEEVAFARAKARRRRMVLVIGIMILAVALLVVGFLIFNSTVFYVGASDSNIAVFRGLPLRIAGIALSEVVEVTSTRYDSLEPYLQQRVDAHDLVSKEEGLRFARGLGSSQ